MVADCRLSMSRAAHEQAGRRQASLRDLNRIRGGHPRILEND